MSTTSTLGLNTHTLRLTLPYLTCALHTSSILSGLYFLLNPPEGAKLFGAPFTNDDSPTPSELAFTRIHGVRDLAMGLVGLRMVNYAWALQVKGDLVGARGVGVAVGMLVWVGAGFLVSDGVICGEAVGGVEGVEGEVKDREEGSAVLRHLGMAVPIAALGAAWMYI